MKKVLFTLVLLVSTTGLFAADEVATISGGMMFDLGTFTGLVALVSFLVTQLAKLIPAIDAKRWLKILVSVAVGAIASVLAWLTDLAAFMAGLDIWQVLLYGVGAGLSGCGFYDIVKPFLNLFTKKE